MDKIKMICLCVLISAIPSGAVINHGLLGRYYNDLDFQELAATRIDTMIDFAAPAFAEAPPGTDVVKDGSFSVRWTGYIHADSSGSWRFYLASDDGVRLWINNELKIDNWKAHSETEDRVSVRLPEGWHSIRLDYFQDGGPAVLCLRFRSPKQRAPVVVPPHLFSAYDPQAGLPFADAGRDTFVVAPADSFLLQGSAVDTNGTIASTEWQQLTGPSAVTLVNPDRLNCRIRGLELGHYTFRLEVIDNDGDADADTIGITAVPAAADPVVSGELKMWHRVSITFDGPPSSEAGSLNPFLDYRLNVTFTGPGGQIRTVPGYYATDGDAAVTSAFSGRKWRVHFIADETGTWKYLPSFRRGKEIAVSIEPLAGESAGFDGAGGTFRIEASDKSSADFRGKGLLSYVDGHYLRFSQSGDYFLKGGIDSPENFLAYYEFDGTWDNGGSNTAPLVDGLHRYEAHISDWEDGDPLWQDGRGRGIIGALNYLAAERVNSIYFLTMNVTGDGDDVWPWTGPQQYLRFDVSKLDQWEIVFSHMDRLGIQLHAVTQETENDQLLNNGDLGTERKLYYRELIARFAHHLALVWNLGEETSNTPEQIRAYSTYIKALDPYDHPVVVHNDPQRDGYEPVFAPLLGHPDFDGTSLQIFKPQQGDRKLAEHWLLVHPVTLEWRHRSENSGRPWIVCADEMGGWKYGLETDARDPDHDHARKHGLWGNLMAGGAGVEWYAGSASGSGTTDQTNEDFRNRRNIYLQTKLALDFFQDYLPFWEMEPADSTLSDSTNHCLAKYGDTYAVYLPDGGAADLDLGVDSQRYWVNWYDPRKGGGLQRSEIRQVQGPGTVSLGPPPHDRDKDWAVLVSTWTPVEVDPSDSQTAPGAYRLLPNHPNPFNPMTEISYQLPVTSEVTLKVYTVNGRLVDTLVEGTAKPGEHRVNFYAKDKSTGVYFYKLTANEFTQIGKMLLLR